MKSFQGQNLQIPNPIRQTTPPCLNPPPQLSIPASLRFDQGRIVLRVEEVAGRLKVTARHVVGLIETGRIQALNISSTGPAGRRRYRIPVESWECYVRSNLL